MSIDGIMPKVKRILRRQVFHSNINRVLSKLSPAPLILGFHRVKEVSSDELDLQLGAVRTEDFLQVIEYVKQLGYTFTSLEKVQDGALKRTAGRIAVITFDDGFKDLYEYAYPLLLDRGIPFTLFLTTATLDAVELLWLHRIPAALDLVPPERRSDLFKDCDGLSGDLNVKGHLFQALVSFGRDGLISLAQCIAEKAGLSMAMEREIAGRLYLSSLEIREMMEHGLDVQAHSHHHWPLLSLGPSEIADEIRQSCRIIRERFDKSPQFFCLPFGMGLNEVLRGEALSELRGICTSESALVGRNGRHAVLPRIMIYSDMVDFAYVLTRAYLADLLGR